LCVPVNKGQIVFTVYRRPWYLREVLEGWRNVRGIKDWNVRFHVDASDQSEAQARIIAEFNAWHGSSTGCFHDKTLGVALNPFHALDTAFKSHDRVILAEEDVTVSDDILEWYEHGLSHDDVLAVCAWSDYLGEVHEYERRRWFNPWGWATTAGKWESVIRPTWDMDYSTGDHTGPGGWDCNLGLRVVNDKNMDVLFPRRSRTQHVGKWLGTHQDPNHFGEMEMPAGFAEHREPVAEWIEVPNVHL
jgi:hypothetical protein